MRLFIAVKLSENACSEAERAQKAIYAAGGGEAVFSRTENLHLTLAFIGESTALAQIKAALSKVKHRSFEFYTSQPGHFGDLWFLKAAPEADLISLANAVRDALDKAGIDFDRKPFRPHITVAREAHIPGFEFKPAHAVTKADGIVLLRSDRINGRLTYTEVFTLPLE